MSQEQANVQIEIPGKLRYWLAKKKAGGKISREIEISTNGIEDIPLLGGVSAASNHRNNQWDVPILGWEMRQRRTPFYPAKIEVNRGIKGWVLEGSGALYFKRGDSAEERRIYELMIQHIKEFGHMVLTMVEGTSKNRGRELGNIKAGALRLALRAGLEELFLIGLAGTETEKVRPVFPGEDPAEVDDSMPKKVHIEVAQLPLKQLTGEYEGKIIPFKAIREFEHDVVIPTHQEIIDIAYEKVGKAA